MARQIDGIALGAVAAGALFLYAGATNRSVTKALQAIVAGGSPGAVPQNPFPSVSVSGQPTTSAGAISGSSATGQQIAADGMAYQGQLGYSWDGSMNSGKPDCSGFVNGVLGRDLHMAIPGYKAGTFDGSVHGPSSFAYPLWGGAARISRSQVEAGDLCVWMNPVGHIGIAISSSQMVSDLDPTQGVQVTPIDGTAAGALICLRLKATLPSATGGGGGRKK